MFGSINHFGDFAEAGRYRLAGRIAINDLCAAVEDECGLTSLFVSELLLSPQLL